MLRRKILGYIEFFSKCFAMLAEDKLLFSAFLALSTIGALTEGVAVSLLVPILQSQGNPGGFGSIPLLGHVASTFDDMTPNERIRVVALLLGGVFVLRGILQYCIDALGQIVPLRLTRHTIMQNFNLMMGVRISYMTERNYGALASDITGWAERVSLLLINFASFLWGFLVLVVYTAMMVSVSWKLTLLSLTFLAFISVALKRLSNGPLREAGLNLSTANARMNQTIMETLMGMKLIRLTAAEQQVTERFQQCLFDKQACQRRQGLVAAASSPMLSTCAGIFICALLFISAIAHEGDPGAWVGSILIFLFLLFRLLGPVNQIANARSRIVSEIPAFEELEKYRRLASELAQSNGTRVIEKLRDDVVLDQVDFSYGTDEHQILARVSATIEHGKMTAVVGPSGAGKSTLIALLTRLYDPQGGSIRIGDTDLRDLNVQSWRKRLAVVSQDIFIFNDTVANNLRFGRGDLPLERLREAARLAAADEFIEKLPEGYDTLLGDRGVRLSGGQQQRIAIARAILADPDLLVMDEATSHLDTFTERAIQNAVDRLSQNRTLLVIAHRLSTIRRADKVIVMKDGRIVEEGRHQDLLEKRGIYWEMVEHQRLDLVDETQPEGTQS